MELYEFPLNSSQHMKLQLTEPIERFQSPRADYLNMLVLPSNISKADSSKIKWFFDYLQNKTRVTAIAKRSGKLYWVLKSTKSGEHGQILLPHRIVPMPAMQDYPNNGTDSQMISIDTWIVLTILRESINSLDFDHLPFYCAGASASDFADFTRPQSEAVKRDWQNTIVCYSAMDGDAMLVRKGDTVAWHLLETNEIITAGKFEDMIVNYLQSSFAAEELSASSTLSESKDVKDVDETKPGGRK